jgi:hypothetical protein
MLKPESRLRRWCAARKCEEAHAGRDRAWGRPRVHAPDRHDLCGLKAVCRLGPASRHLNAWAFAVDSPQLRCCLRGAWPAHLGCDSSPRQHSGAGRGGSPGRNGKGPALDHGGRSRVGCRSPWHISRHRRRRRDGVPRQHAHRSACVAAGKGKSGEEESRNGGENAHIGSPQRTSQKLDHRIRKSSPGVRSLGFADIPRLVSLFEPRNIPGKSEILVQGLPMAASRLSTI